LQFGHLITQRNGEGKTAKPKLPYPRWSRLRKTGRAWEINASQTLAEMVHVWFQPIWQEAEMEAQGPQGKAVRLGRHRIADVYFYCGCIRLSDLK